MILQRYKKAKGVVLHEVLIIISILGILAIAVQAVYSAGIEKARDSKRIETLHSVESIIQIEMMESNAIFANQDEFSGVLRKYGYKIQPENNICYFIASIPANESPSGESEYIVATWGERRSNAGGNGKFGVIAVGTSQALLNLTSANISADNSEVDNALSIHDFYCDNSVSMQKIEKAFLGDPLFFQ